MFNQLMIDIETMGTDSFAAIISIGALEFDINTGNTGREFYVNVDLQSSINLGLQVSASTIMWWIAQGERARKSLSDNEAIHIIRALEEFAAFCSQHNYEVWANAPRFDCGLLQNAYSKVNMTVPWDFRKERCVRTLAALRPDIKNKYPNPSTAHHALQDCYYQAGYCSAVWAELNRNIQQL